MEFDYNFRITGRDTSPSNCFTRWVELYPLKTLTAEEAITAIIHYFCTYGTPVAIKTDNGK